MNEGVQSWLTPPEGGSDEMLGGVCVWLESIFNINVKLFRAIFLICLFIGGIGVGAYAILWLILQFVD